MTKRRNQEEFQQELTQLLLQEGISNLTVEKMAERLKCSRRRIYEIAPSKEALFVEVSRQALDATLARGFAAARKESDPARAIPAYLGATVGTSGLSKQALVDLDNLDTGRAVFDAYQLARMNGLESLINEGIRQGVLVARNARLISEGLLGAVGRLRNQQFLEESGLTIKQAFIEFYEVILNGLLKEPLTQTAKPATRKAGVSKRVA